MWQYQISVAMKTLGRRKKRWDVCPRIYKKYEQGLKRYDREQKQKLKKQQREQKQKLKKQQRAARVALKRAVRVSRSRAKKISDDVEKSMKRKSNLHKLSLREHFLTRKQNRLAKEVARLMPLALETASLMALVDQDRAALGFAKTKTSSLMSRKSDSAKHLCLDQIRELEKQNVPFDEAAEAKKKEIWGEEYKTTCQATGVPYKDQDTGKVKKGLSLDHSFPVRGAYGNAKNPKTGYLHGGLRGSDSEWNSLPVAKQLNSSFKIVDHLSDHGWKKDVSWQTLTPEEYEQCPVKERSYYDKQTLWRKYVVSRGARYCWQYTTESNIANEEFLKTWYAIGSVILPVVALESDVRSTV